MAAGDVDARRARMARLASLGQRLGYGLFGLALVGFVVAVVAGFPGPVVSVVIVALVTGSVVLAPAIVLGYGVKAAEREDREWRS
jgi:hypothetical protein